MVECDIPSFPALTRKKEAWHLLNLETELPPTATTATTTADIG